MALVQLPSFTKTVSMLPDNPALTPADLKAQFDAAPTELLTYFNNLITALKQTTSGDSGAQNIGVTAITGLTGTDVQTLLASLKTYIDGLSYLPALGSKKKQGGATSTIALNPGASQDVTFYYREAGFVNNPAVTYSFYNTDVDGNYTLAHCMVGLTNIGATVRIKNKGTTAQNFIIDWHAIEI